MTATRRPSAWVQLRAVFRKEVLQTTRDRRMMFLLVVAPLVQSIVFGYAVDFDVDRVPTVVVDLDKTADSRKVTRRLLADKTLVRVGEAPSVAAAEEAIDSWRAAAALVIPRGFAQDVAAGRRADVQVVLDGTDPNRSTVASGAASRFFGEMGDELARADVPASGGLRAARLSAVPKILYSPSLRTAPYIVPGVMAMLLLIVTTIVTAMGMTRERETGTLEQMLVTPIRPLYLLVGKVAPFLVVGLFDVLLVLATGTVLFDVPLRGSLGLVFFATLLYLLTTLGIGLFISTISKTQQQSFLSGFLFVLPAILLSGTMSPIRAMPDWLATATYANPVRYYVELLRAVLLRGATWADVRVQLVALAAFGVGILAAAVLRFHKRIA